MTGHDPLSMLTTHCPICHSGPKLDCSDMAKCPLALAKFRGVFLTPLEFAHLHKVEYVLPSVFAEQPDHSLKHPKLVDVAPADQFSLF